jgi:hypothetical protein
MVGFAKSKEDFLRTFLELPNGIPSEDTINRLLTSINSIQLENCFIEWVSSIADLSLGQIIAIDGKTIRGAKHKGKKSPIHMVSAWACENNLVLGQVKTEDKSNEITAIPNLLDILDISGNIVSIDANYILAVKGNQSQLLEHIEDEFRFSKQIEIDKNEDLGHGRVKTRICSVITDFLHLGYAFI